MRFHHSKHGDLRHLIFVMEGDANHGLKGKGCLVFKEVSHGILSYLGHIQNYL